MSLETLEDIKEFIKLSALSSDEIYQQCKDLDLDIGNKTKSELIKLIAKAKTSPVEQTYDKSQGIPLRSKLSNGKSIPNASETYKKWRVLIFQAENNLKDFTLQNKEGKEYVAKAYYIKCKSQTALSILDNKWYSVYESQMSTIEEILKDPDKFEFNIIRKNANNGHNFLMLHCQLKEDNQ